MNRENFQTLLTDLYNIYNPSKVKDIPKLLDDYNGQEFDALKTFYFKYNYRTHAKFDEKAGTDKHVKFLIEKYSTGERVLLNGDMPTEINIEEFSLNNKVEAASSQINDITAKTTLSVEEYFKKKTAEIDEYFIRKTAELENYKLQINNIPIFTGQTTSVSVEEKVELKLNLNFEDTDLVLPKEINSMPAGSRFIVLNSNNVICALEVKDVFFDWVTFKGAKCIKEITIERI